MTRHRTHHSMAPDSTMEWLPEHDNAIREWVDQGFSRQGIAIELNAKFGTNTTRCAVIGRCNRRGIKSKLKTGDNMKTLRKPRKIAKPKFVSGPIRIEQPPRMVREDAEIRCAAIEPRHLTLLELEPNDCRYPYGDDAITFCGHLKSDGSSYCPDHRALSMRPLHGNMGQERPNFAALMSRAGGHRSAALKLGAISEREDASL